MAAFVWTGAISATWATGANWSVGGVPQAAPPGATDDVHIGNGTGATNNNITLTASTTVQSVDCTGYTGVFTHNNNLVLTISGNTFKLVAGMTYTRAANTRITFTSTSGTTQITTGGKTMGRVTINGPGGTFELQDDWVSEFTTDDMTVTAGTFDANDKDVTIGTFASSNSNTRVINMGSGTWTLRGTGTLWNTSTITNGQLNSETSTIVVEDTSATSKTLSGGAGNGFNVFYNVQITGGGSGTIIFSSGNKTYNIIDVVGGTATLQFTAGTTYTILTDFIPSNGTDVVTLTSTSSTNFILSKSSGYIVCNYLTISDSTATGGATWFAGDNSTDAGGGNSGWIFTGAAISHNDGVSVGDSMAQAIGNSLDDGVAVSEGLSQAIGKNLADEVEVADTQLRAVGHFIEDGVEISDAQSRTVGNFLADGVVVDDSFSSQTAYSKLIADGVTVADAIRQAMGKGLSDGVNVSDSISRLIGERLADGVEVEDNLTQLLMQYPTPDDLLIAHILGVTGIGIHKKRPGPPVFVSDATPRGGIEKGSPDVEIPDSAPSFQFPDIDADAAAVDADADVDAGFTYTSKARPRVFVDIGN